MLKHFHKNDPLYDPALKVRLYNPAGKRRILEYCTILRLYQTKVPPPTKNPHNRLGTEAWAGWGWLGASTPNLSTWSLSRDCSSDPLSGQMAPQPPNSAPGLSTWAAHSPREVDGGGPTLKTTEELCLSLISLPSEDGHPVDNCPPFRVSLPGLHT